VLQVLRPDSEASAVAGGRGVGGAINDSSRVGRGILAAQPRAPVVLRTAAADAAASSCAWGWCGWCCRWSTSQSVAQRSVAEVGRLPTPRHTPTRPQHAGCVVVGRATLHPLTAQTPAHPTAAVVTDRRGAAAAPIERHLRVGLGAGGAHAATCRQKPRADARPKTRQAQGRAARPTRSPRGVATTRSAATWRGRARCRRPSPARRRRRGGAVEAALLPPPSPPAAPSPVVAGGGLASTPAAARVATTDRLAPDRIAYRTAPQSPSRGGVRVQCTPQPGRSTAQAGGESNPVPRIGQPAQPPGNRGGEGGGGGGGGSGLAARAGTVGGGARRCTGRR